MSNLSQRLPPLTTLVVFEAAYRLCSFSRAGDELALSQASVSRRIRELETDLGVSLFERRRYDVAPTAEGEMLAASVHLTLHELAATTERLRARGSGSKVFTIFSDISIASTLITPHLGEFQQRYPDIQFRLLSSYEPIDKITQTIDVGFQVGRLAEELFDIDAVADDAIFPVCSPKLSACLPTPFNAADLVNQPLLHLEDLGRGWPDWRGFLAMFRIKEPRPIDGLLFNSYQVCLEAAEKGQGVALGWARSVKSKLDEGKLMRIPNMTMYLPESVFVYRPKRSAAKPITNQFINTLRSKVESVKVQRF